MKQFSTKQKTAMTWWANPKYKEYDAIICDGAVRSGKTLSMGMGFFLWAMRRFSGEQFALCGKTIISLRRNVLHEILPKVTALGFHCEEKRSENLVVVRSGGRENRFYLFGGYDEGSAALIQGVTLAGVLFDEAALMPRSFVEQASARCSVGQQAVVQLQPRGADALVLPRVDPARGGARGAVSALYDGRQSVALAAHSGAVRKGIQRDILPAVHPGRVDGGEGAHL